MKRRGKREIIKSISASVSLHVLTAFHASNSRKLNCADFRKQTVRIKLPNPLNISDLLAVLLTKNRHLDLCRKR